MCAVSLLAQPDGFLLGMNRDENRRRPAGLPPEVRHLGGITALCPAEQEGGTWIGVNDAGTTFALVNWYAIARRVASHPQSRGTVVVAALQTSFPEESSLKLHEHPLRFTNPFRLIGVFPNTHQIVEWRWDLSTLMRLDHVWQEGIWCSSGRDEPGASRIRTETFRRARLEPDAGTAGWLRRVHRSHEPATGPYSICMHREDAVTVSYTEIQVQGGSAMMRHKAGSPCEPGPEHLVELPLVR